MPYQSRFEATSIDSEEGHHYSNGGYLPLELGHFVEEGTLQVVRKLGFGEDSTTWLARPVMQSKDPSQVIALKVGRAITEACLRDIEIYKAIGDSPHLVRLYDSFQEESMNGSHENKARLSYQHKKSIAEQFLLGLHEMHEAEFAHGNLNLSHVLVSARHSLKDLDFEDPANKWEALVRRDGQPDLRSPSRLYESRPLQDIDLDAIEVKLTGLGAAYPFDNLPTQPRPRIHLRAPETVLEGDISYKCDIFAYACLIYEMFAERSLIGDAEMDEDEYHERLNALLGPYNTNEELANRPNAKALTPFYRHIACTMKDVPEKELDDLHDMLAAGLEYDPQKRATTKQLLESEYFRHG